MPLHPEQLQRLQTRFAGLTVFASCTVVDSWFGAGVQLAEEAAILHSKIGEHSRIGANSSVHHTDIGRHCEVGSHCRIGGTQELRETRIGDDVHIGANTCIHPGVTIGNGAFIPENSVIATDIPADAHAPCREPLSTIDPDHALPLNAFLLEKLPLVHMFNKWCADRGDETFRIDYALTPASTLVDVGGYHGDWAADMSQRYGATVHVYEPVQSFADGIASRFANNHRIHLHRSGLAGQTRQERISLASESSSIVKQDDGTRMETIQLVAARDAFQQLDGEIAVLKINIEGCEYELLDHLLDEGLLKRVRHLQVQFHEFVPEARNHRRAIRSRLRATHVERWNYPFLWEGWERRDDAK